MNRGMHTRESRGKVIAAIIGIVCLLGLFYGGMRWAEKRWLEKQEANATDKGNAEEWKKMLWGEISLYGKKYRYPRAYETYLIIGTDASGNEEGEGNDYYGNMADFLMLAIVNKEEKNYSFLQLNRDTVTAVRLLPSDGNQEEEFTMDMQLCVSHWYGSTPEESGENTVHAVQNLLGGMPIDGYYAVNMEDIGALNQAVGGVTVTIEEDFSDIDPDMKKGATVTLSDAQARTYVQGRMGVGDGENTSRMRRQRQYMEALFEKVQEISKDDPQFTVNLYNDLVDRSVTNVSGNLVSDLALELSGAENLGIVTFEGESKTGQVLGDGIDHAEFYLDEGSVTEVMKQLYELEEIK